MGVVVAASDSVGSGPSFMVLKHSCSTFAFETRNYLNWPYCLIDHIIY